MASSSCSDRLWTLSGELLGDILAWLTGQEMTGVSSTTGYLLPHCERARLQFFLLQLEDRRTSGPRRRLSDGSHVLRSLRPPQTSRRLNSARNEKAVQLALTRLGRVAQEGDRLAILSILPWLEHGELSTRAAAVRAVAKVAPRGEPGVVEALLARLRDPSLCGEAMEAVIEALPQMVTQGDPEIVRRIYALLESPTFDVRCAALQALPVLVHKGDEAAIEKVLARMEDKEIEIRENAIRTLKKVAGEDHHQALTWFIRGLRDESIYVRRAALEALPCQVVY
eukprot:TRINITY_DN65191_c0_g1_i1.p1 TRINITY_DN65191_c0_g1~~TRINITY_DN65191_c0_g1_i1.p1  ORF type:complete len:282 (-),score=53.31 TRINITY_DN65191_c0_g1_i1:23-868(-)